MEMLEAARREYHEDQVQPTALEVLQPGNMYLREVVDSYLKKTRGQTNKIQIACFFELKSSNVGRIVGKEDRTRFVVSESSGCLDLSDATSKYSLSRTHFDMNKFAKASEEDFETPTALEVLQPGNMYLREVVDSYLKKTRGQTNKIQIACFFELKSSNVGRIVGKEDRTRFVVSESSGCLDLSDATSKYSLSRTHFDMNKFAKASEKDFETFSAVFWLNGSSAASLKQSFVDIAQKIPRGELTADGAAQLSDATVEADVAVRECQRWLSIPSNPHWLLLIDNVDRDHHDQEDPQAYHVQTFFPHADHGSILITSRLANLQRLGSGVNVGIVAAEQARAILNNNASRVVENADMVLELLRGLPLALTQAGSYMRETNMSASTYVKHYSRTWERLMKSEESFPLDEYGDRSVLTTWTMSYKQVQRKSEEAACLLKLWGFLDSGEVWYELIAAGSDPAAEVDAPAWLLAVAEDELAFGKAMGLLSRYSLAEGREGTDSHSMHSVLHRWCRYVAEKDEQQELGCLAAGLVAWSVPLNSDTESWKKRKRVMAHGLRVSGWIEDDSGLGSDLAAEVDAPAWLLAVTEDELAFGEAMGLLSRYSLAEGREGTDSHSMHSVLHRWCGYVAGKHERQELGCLAAGLVAWSVPLESDAEFLKKRKRVMAHGLRVSGWIEEDSGLGKEKVVEVLIRPDHFHNLGYLLNDEDRQRALQMYQRALKGKEKAWGLEHTSTLSTVNNLGLLYVDLGRLDEAEKMYQRALQGYEKAWGLEHTSTLNTLNILNNLGNLYAGLGRLDEAEKMLQRALQGKEKAWGLEHTSTLDTVNDLGNLYADLGRLEEAEKMYQRALQGFEKAWGPEHTSTLSTVNNLGILYADLGRLDEAEKMLQRALQGYEKAWGPEHTSTLDTSTTWATSMRA
ncbi:TadD, Flp pilus assembly protein TadD, contains TPR repeat protein [Pyrenophora tritici-repentis]|nr:TadD, Flp pilus assembly protein TadD, contains TPR repeat protein [Pyrenophora tritici-repentis]